MNLLTGEWWEVVLNIMCLPFTLAVYAFAVGFFLVIAIGPWVLLGIGIYKAIKGR